MNKNLLKWILLLPSLLMTAKNTPDGLLRETIKNKVEKVNAENIWLDSLWSYTYYTAGIDTSLKVFNFWDEENGEPLGYVSYQIRKGVKYYKQKNEILSEQKGQIRKYVENLYDWDSTSSTWFHKTKSEYLRDFSTLHDTTILYVTLNGVWIPHSKYGDYAIADSLNSSNYYWSRENQNWNPSFRDIVKKNSAGKILYTMRLEWDKTLNDFVGLSKQEWAYDQKGVTFSNISYTFNIEKGIWSVSNSNVSSPDPTDGVYREHYARYEGDSVTRTGTIIKEYLFDKAGNITQEKISSIQANKFIEYKRNEYVYDEKNRLTVILNHLVNEGAVVQTTRFDYAYDQSGNKILEAEIAWDALLYVQRDKKEYTYDDYGNLIQMNAYGPFWSQGDWPISLVETRTYSKHTLGLSEILVPSHQFYPNPVAELINYALPEKVAYEIYDVNGQSQLAGYDSSINTSNLVSGTYTLRFESQGKFFAQKIVKK